MYLEKNKVIEQLLEIAGNSDKPIIIHSDLLQVGFFRNIRTPDTFLNDHRSVFQVLAKHRPLIFPAFNYDFCMTGIYDVQNSPSQVGSFADFLRKEDCVRTRTPVFNFCLLGEIDTKYILPYQNVFGEDSVFSLLPKTQGDVLFWGADFSANTFFHFVEEVLNIGYRYLKKFYGKVIFRGNGDPFEVLYRVRPMTFNVFDYDWAKQREDLVQAGILKVRAAGRGEALLFNANEFMSVITQKMKGDELFYLTTKAKNEVLQAKKNFDYPFKIKDFELV